MTQVLAFKLIGGDEVVAEVLDTLYGTQMLLENQTEVKGSSGSITAYVVRRPHILQFQPISPGKVGLAFVPWTLSNPTIERLEIPVSAVILTFSPASNVEDNYLSQTSGLEIAKSTTRISVPK